MLQSRKTMIREGHRLERVDGVEGIFEGKTGVRL